VTGIMVVVSARAASVVTFVMAASMPARKVRVGIEADSFGVRALGRLHSAQGSFAVKTDHPKKIPQTHRFQ